RSRSRGGFRTVAIRLQHLARDAHELGDGRAPTPVVVRYSPRHLQDTGPQAIVSLSSHLRLFAADGLRAGQEEAVALLVLDRAERHVDRSEAGGRPRAPRTVPAFPARLGRRAVEVVRVARIRVRELDECVEERV